MERKRLTIEQVRDRLWRSRYWSHSSDIHRGIRRWLNNEPCARLNCGEPGWRAIHRYPMRVGPEVQRPHDFEGEMR